MTEIVLDKGGAGRPRAHRPAEQVAHPPRPGRGLPADGPSIFYDPLLADDTRLTIAGLRQLGAAIEVGDRVVGIEGAGGPLAGGDGAVLDCGNSGTTLRLLASVAALADGRITLTGSARMLERPIGHLGTALEALGATVRYPVNAGVPPIEVAGPLRGGEVAVDGGVSSQFASSLLLAAPLMPEGLVLRLASAPVSRSYLDLTVGVMAAFGADVDGRGTKEFAVRPGSTRASHMRSRGTGPRPRTSSPWRPRSAAVSRSATWTRPRPRATGGSSPPSPRWAAGSRRARTGSRSSGTARCTGSRARCPPRPTRSRPSP